MSMVNVNIRMDKNLKERFEEFCKNVGMTMSTAMSVFATRAVEEKKIPFEVKEPEDPFYSESNMKWLMESIEEGKKGNFIIKTMEELEAMENE